MKEVYKFEYSDSSIEILFKTEANIALASVENDAELYSYKKNIFDLCFKIIQNIADFKPRNKQEIKDILSTINDIFNIYILSPLTLKDDEFIETYPKLMYKPYYNKRYTDIIKDDNNNIINRNSYRGVLKKLYSHVDKKELEFTNGTKFGQITNCIPIYLSKGGVLNGEYIYDCIIKKEIIDKHSYTPHNIIHIPISTIFDKDESVCCVDYREPALKILREFYDVPILFDENVASKKYNIRKYKKLK